MGDGVKTLGLHLRATCRGVVLRIFGSIYLRSVGDISIIFPCSFAVGITQQYGIYVLLG